MKLTFTEDTDLEKKRRECLHYLNRSRVDVGLTSGASERSRFLMALHEHGAPGAHIPARPVITPALGTEKARETISRELVNAAAAAHAGDRDAMQAALLAVKLPHLEGWHRGRAENATTYRKLFAEAGLAGEKLRLRCC